MIDTMVVILYQGLGTLYVGMYVVPLRTPYCVRTSTINDEKVVLAITLLL